jgi:hypothetical protein
MLVEYEGYGESTASVEAARSPVGGEIHFGSQFQHLPAKAAGHAGLVVQGPRYGRR